jgi:hypothetical protein
LQLAQPALSLVWGWPLLGEQLSAVAVVTVVVVLGAVAAGRRAPVQPSPDRVTTAAGGGVIRPIGAAVD